MYVLPALHLWTAALGMVLFSPGDYGCKPRLNKEKKLFLYVIFWPIYRKLTGYLNIADLLKSKVLPNDLG